MIHIVKINGYYYFNRRVPEEVRDLDPRPLIRVSLKTECRRLAARKATTLNQQIEAYWQGLLEKQERHDNSKFTKLVRLARRQGFTYQSAAVVATLPVEEIAQRYLAVEKAAPKQIEAILGDTDEQQGLLLSAALQKFWHFTRERILNKSPSQIRKWKNPRLRAVNNFSLVIGNKDIKKITRDDIIEFKDWWIDRIQNDNLSTATASKDLVHVKNILETVSDNMKLGIDVQHLFKKLIFKKRKSKGRLPFTNGEILSILHSDKLERLNDECRWFLFVAAETGARPSEIVGLLPEDIRLNDPVPHMKIVEREKRALKTEHSERDIPLTGYALQALTALPNGFPRYRAEPDNISTATNKFLRDNKLLPSKKHSVYSFRHSFQDRLTAVDAPDRVQAELMGHKFERIEYGDGPTLKKKLEWMDKIQIGKI